MNESLVVAVSLAVIAVALVAGEFFLWRIQLSLNEHTKALQAIYEEMKKHRDK